MGINSILQRDMQNAGLAGSDRLAGNSMFPQSQMDATQYATPSQMPTSAEVMASDYDQLTSPYNGNPVNRLASGGIAALRYDDGGNVETSIENDPRYTNPDFQNINIDLEQANALNALKETNLDQYNSQLMGLLNQSLKEQYNTNSNYEPTWKQFKSLQESDPAAWHKYQLDWLGHHQGWQIGQNTSDRNAAEQPVIQDEIEQARKAGLSDQEIQQVLGQSSQKANLQNQQRIINEQQAGHGPLGMTTQDYLTVAAILGSGAAAAYFAPAMAGAGTGSGIGLTAAQVPNLAAGLGATGGAAAGTGAGWGGLTAASTGGMGLTAASVPSLAGSLAVPTTGALAAGVGTAGEAASSLPSLKDVYKAYSYGKKGLGVLNALSGAGGQTAGTGGGYGISAAPAASQYVAFNPTIQAPTGLGISNTYNPLATQPLFLSKLSEFKADQPAELASGGIADLGGYSDGGRLLRGPGDGMSDHIPATIGGKQPARLADGEFVIPADVVSHLGNGSTDAGAKQLYKMMDNIRKARTGNPKQGKQINPDKFTPKG